MHNVNVLMHVHVRWGQSYSPRLSSDWEHIVIAWDNQNVRCGSKKTRMYVYTRQPTHQQYYEHTYMPNKVGVRTYTGQYR